MYSMKDYGAALNERDSYDMDSAAWELAQQKVQGIITAMVASGNTQMVHEIVDEVCSLNECGASLADAAIQFDLWLLESNGYEKQVQKLRELDWE